MTSLDELIALQDLDTGIDQRRHRIETHPARAALTAAQAAVRAAVDQRNALASQRADIATTQKGIEREVADVEAKIAHVNGQLYGGSVTSPKELEALQHEIGTLTDIQRGFEDQVIEQMELAEPVDEALAAAEAAIVEAETTATQAEGDLTIAVAELQAELADLEPQRDATVAGLPADLVAEYDLLRRQLGGVAAARLVGGRCEGCHLSLPAVEVDTIKKMAPGEVAHCPECGRILVR